MMDWKRFSNPTGPYRGERYVSGHPDLIDEVVKRCLPQAVHDWVKAGPKSGETRYVEFEQKDDGRVWLALRYGGGNRAPYKVVGHGHTDQDTGYDTEEGYCQATKMAAADALKRVDKYPRQWK